MANTLPRVDVADVIVDPNNPNNNPKLYLPLNADPATDIVISGLGPAGGNITNTVVYTQPDTSVSGTTTVTFTLSGYPDYTYAVDIVVLAEGELAPPQLCMLRKGPYIHIPGLVSELDSVSGLVVYKQYVVAGTIPEPNWAVGTDGRLCTNEILMEGPAPDTSVVASTLMSLTLVNDPTMPPMNYTLVVVASEADIPDNPFGVKMAGEVPNGDGSYTVTLLPGSTDAVPQGVLWDGTLAGIDNANYAVGITGIPNFNTPGEFNLAFNISDANGPIAQSCKDYRIIIKKPEGVLPRIEIDGLIIGDDGKGDLCVDIGVDPNTLPKRAYYADGSSATGALTLSTSRMDFTAPGTQYFVASIPSNGGYPGVDLDIALHIGLEACKASRINTGCVVDDQEHLPYPSAYYGHYDWPTPLRNTCKPAPIGLDPGDSVPKTIWWVEDYENNFHNSVLANDEIIKKYQMSFYNSLMSMLTVSDFNDTRMTDLLNRIRDVPRVYSETMFLRGMSDLVPSDLPEWYPELIKLLVRAAKDAERPLISTNTDIATLLTGAPQDAVDFLVNYFNGLATPGALG